MNASRTTPFRATVLLASLFALASSPDPGAAESGSDGTRLQGDPLRYEITDYLTFSLPGYYRFRFTHLSDMVLAEIPSGQRAGEQERLGEIDYTEHRLRFKPKITLFDQLHFESLIDVVGGMLSGSTAGRDILYFSAPEQRWNDHDGWDTNDFAELHFKRYWGTWESPVGELRVGRQGSDWGLGMLVNNGNGFSNDFGDAYYGDTVDRVLFATKPYSLFSGLLMGEEPEHDPITIAFGYDWNVVRDNLLKRAVDKEDIGRASPDILLYPPIRDDQAHQYVGAILAEQGPVEGGFYVAWRHMDHYDALLPPDNRPQNEFLEVWVFDAFGKVELEPEFLGGGTFFLQAEGAHISGTTNLTVSKVIQSPGNPFPESDVNQWGGVLRTGVRFPWIKARVEVGYASGDSDPFDDRVENFKFHPDYNVGMILFEDLVANTTAASAFNSTLVFDEGGPVRTQGASLVPTNGAVTNAIYVNPAVTFYPVDGLEGIVSFLWARADTKWVDPIIDYLFGGGYGIYNPYGAPATNKDYGCEIDVGLKYTWDRTYFDLVLGVQYAHFFPGNAFETVRGERLNDIDKVQGRLTLLW